MSVMSKRRFETIIDETPIQAPPADRVACVAFLADADSQDVVRAVCEPHFAGCQVRQGGAREVLESLAEAAAPRVLIVDVSDTAQPLSAILPVMAAFAEDTKLIAVGVVNDVNLYRELVEAGVVEYLVKPLNERALLAALARIEEQAATKSAQTAAPVAPAPAPEPQRRQVVAVLGTRGGVGASTVAINVAWLLAHEFNRRTALLDFDLQTGTVALALDVEPTRGLREALENPDRIDSLFISSATAKIGNRLSVMAAEESVDEEVHFDPGAVGLLLEVVHHQSDCIVVDLPRVANPARSRVIAAATEVILVTDLTLAGLRDAIRLSGIVQQAAAKARLFFVANRAGGREMGVPRLEFEKALGHKLSFVLPEDIKASIVAANAGKPLAAAASGSRTTRELRSLAQQLGPSGQTVAKRRTWPLLTKLRK